MPFFNPLSRCFRTPQQPQTSSASPSGNSDPVAHQTGQTDHSIARPTTHSNLANLGQADFRHQGLANNPNVPIAPMVNNGYVLNAGGFFTGGPRRQMPVHLLFSQALEKFRMPGTPAELRQEDFDNLDEDRKKRLTEFLEQTLNTTEYAVSPLSQEALVEKINTMLHCCKEEGELAGKIDTLISSGVENCHDNTIATVGEIEGLINLDKALNSPNPRSALTDLAWKGLAQEELDKCVTKKLAELHAKGRSPDQLEVKLAYQTAIATEINLPSTISHMNHRLCAPVDDSEIEEAKNEIKDKLTPENFNAYIGSHEPWARILVREPAAKALEYNNLKPAKLENAHEQTCSISLNNFDEIEHPVCLVKRNGNGEVARDNNNREVTQGHVFELEDLKQAWVNNKKNPNNAQEFELDDLRKAVV